MADVKLSDVKAGDTIELDDGFPCWPVGGQVAVEADADGDLYFACTHGKHFLEGQTDEETWDVMAGVIGHTPKVAS